LSVARDLATGKEQSITVNATGTLSEDEIQRIIDENELYEVKVKE
jgi:molecular chaperone DnaK (HSP70)